MKTFQIKLSNLGAVFLILLTLVVSSCSEVKHEKEDQNQVTEADIKELRTKHIIPLEQAVKQYDKYTKQRCELLKDTLRDMYRDNEFEDTRTVWFDVKTIKAYLAYIDKYAADAEGFQFYFGVNSSSDEGDKKNHQTFFVAPTIEHVNKKGDTIQSGFTINDGKRVFIYDEVKKYLEESSAQNVQEGNFFRLMRQDEGLLLNEGEPNPPGDGN